MYVVMCPHRNWSVGRCSIGLLLILRHSVFHSHIRCGGGQHGESIPTIIKGKLCGSKCEGCVSKSGLIIAEHKVKKVQTYMMTTYQQTRNVSWRSCPCHSLIPQMCC